MSNEHLHHAGIVHHETDPAVRKSSLPPELLSLVPARLRLVAWLSVSTWSLILLMNLFYLMDSNGRPEFSTGMMLLGNGVKVMAVLVSASMVWLSYRWESKPQRLLIWGQLFALDMAGAIAIAENLLPYEPGEFPRGLSWVVPWILVVPLLIPMSSLRALLIGAVALSFPAAAQWYLVSIGHSHLDPPLIPVVLAYHLIALPLIVIPTRVLYGVTRTLKEARRLGSYQLVELLGKGGMGEVWRARHQLLARPAAIKLIRPERMAPGEDTSKLTKRFAREAQATAVLRSPHTLQVFDFGITEDGTFYYVMELLDGVDLQQLVDRFGPLEPRRAVDMLLAICHSLDEAHDSGLIHRDIKPANLMICRNANDFDFIKVLDFGMVKREKSADDQDATLTADGAMAGTPAFIAPENVLGLPLDARADIYSLGCVAFWLLSGQLVFTGETSMQVAVKHASHAPPRLCDVSELEIPAALEAIVMDCLQKTPDDRPQSARDLRRRLEALDLDWTEDEAQQWWRDHLPDLAQKVPASRILVDGL